MEINERPSNLNKFQGIFTETYRQQTRHILKILQHLERAFYIFFNNFFDHFFYKVKHSS